MNKETQSRTVTDLALAAFLVSAGHPLQAIHRLDGRGAFLFEDMPGVAEAILRFYNRRGTVDPLTFAETLRNLKAAVQAS